MNDSHEAKDQDIEPSRSNARQLLEEENSESYACEKRRRTTGHERCCPLAEGSNTEDCTCVQTEHGLGAKVTSITREKLLMLKDLQATNKRLRQDVLFLYLQVMTCPWS